MLPKIALVLEDNSDCLSLLTDLLTGMELKVRAFPDPVAYLETRLKGDCTSQCPCVGFILTDNNMPGMSGLEFLEKLEKDGCKLPNDRKAIISGNWTEEMMERAKKLGCRVFHKPFPITEIYAWINSRTENDV